MQPNKKPPAIRLFSSLSFLATACVFLLTLLVLQASGNYIMHELESNARENLDREALSITSIVSKTVAASVWGGNERHALNDLAALSVNNVFCGARIIDGAGKTFASFDYPAKLSLSQQSVTQPIMYDDPSDDSADFINIGKLEACVSSAPLREQVNDILQIMLSAFFALCVGIIIANNLSMQILLSPLRRFKDSMSAFLVTMKPISDPRLLRENEVGDLVKSFNIMAISLSESYRALKKAKEETEELIRVKTDFFANMSHELRTPLNSIIGMTQLVAGSKMDTEQAEMFDSIKRSSDNLLKIVNDILDISKIESKQVQLEYLPFDAYSTIRHTIQSMMPIANQKGLVLTFETKETTQPVFGDPLRFERVLVNIISNAIRYTEVGSVTVFAKTMKTRENRVSIEIEVEDTGIGIPADKIDKIFEKFTQADTSTTRKYGGTGLGLTITKELILLMGGEIYVSSDFGRGSIFSVNIQFETALESDLQKVAKADEFLDGTATQVHGLLPSQVRVLLAEDHMMNQIFMKKLMKNLGMTHFYLAEDGKQALEALVQESYDLILMDCHMPEMNGYDATVAIRNLDDPIKRSIPIVAMTANAMPEDERRCLAVGMTGYISKPIDIGVFKKTLSPWINFTAGTAPLDATPVASAHASDAGIINLDNLRANSMGDADFEREMIAMFVDQGRTQLAELAPFAVDGPSHDWVEVSHALKGTAGTVGADEMRELCAQAQAMEDASATDRAAKLKEISDVYTRVKAELIRQGLYSEA